MVAGAQPSDGRATRSSTSSPNIQRLWTQREQSNQTGTLHLKADAGQGLMSKA